MIQVKSGTLTSHTLQESQRQLSAQVLQAGAGLGLLVYDQATPDARKVPPAPLVFRVGIDELLAELATKPLSAVLTQAVIAQSTGCDMGLDPAVVRRYLDAAAASLTADAQGKAYEALAVHLFETIPGCFAERDIISFFGAEQIDVAVGNPRLPDGLPLLPTVLIVECKDWASR